MTESTSVSTSAENTAAAATAAAIAEAAVGAPSIQYDTTVTEGISKNQLKKKLRAQRWEAAREQRKEFRRVKQSEKRAKKKQIRLEAKNNAESNGEDGATGGNTTTATQAAQGSNSDKMEPARTVDMDFIIDCDFDDLMIDKEITSLGAQLTRCYSNNRKAPRRVNLSMTSVNKRLFHRLKVMHGEHIKSWKHIRITGDPYEVAEDKKENIIYLSSDSADTIYELEEGKTYIIGGIVDKNRHKGVCYNKAVSQGLQTAKLPIGDYIKMASRTVLTTNQVVEIMLKWLETKDWEKAFLECIPQRKNPTKAAGVGADLEKQDGIEAEQDGATEVEAKNGSNQEVMDQDLDDNEIADL